MKSNFLRFNTFLALAPIFLLASCSTKSSEFAKKEQSTIRFYLEGNPGDVAGTGMVLVTRQHIPVTVDRAPFLTEADLRRASLVDDPGPNGGFSIELGFDEHGALMLDTLTTANRGHKIVIFAQFPKVGTKQPKEPKPPKHAEDEDDTKMEDIQASLPLTQPENESPDHPRNSAWLAAVLIRERNPSGIFRFSPDASREEAARIVRGLKNVIAYERALEKY